MNKYFTIEDQQNLIYFQLPKVLMIAEKYKKMSNDAKLLYTYLLDLNRMSMSRNWKDDEGRYYVKLKNEKGMTFIGCKSEKFAKLKKELENFNLIESVRQGRGKVNMTYVLKLEYTDNDVYKVNEVFEDAANDADESDEDVEVRKSNNSTESSEVRKSNNKEFENRTHRNSKIERIEIRKSNTINNNKYINNNINNNNIKDNNSINSSSSLDLDNTSYIVEQPLSKEEEEYIKELYTNLGYEISKSGIMRTNKQIQDTLQLMADRNIFSFDDVDVFNAIDHYRKESAKRTIAVPHLFFANGFEIVLNKRHSLDVRAANNQEPQPKVNASSAVPFYNWLED